MNIHIGLNVTKLDASLSFYSKLFGTKPVKVKQDYVKFLLEDPGLNFTLRPVEHVEGNHINHFGFQIFSKDELNKHKERLEKEGFFSRSESDTTCCYARQDKFWITDPDGHEWEFFLTKEDTEVDTIQTCCG
ncbi:VOC family protein [Metabacillus litoralis]|uniref:ArsI/CadI family heavy metal resistance metalloenzyme n=1 Tax=Metabacillus TaxID=2675233 RepID=UPI000EF5EED4|nr:ArsI/CadI family heavy metal resistance metalloenzyme [Metabacillus litoralis]UHA60437.1 VOC family protein [Metabacillus litoralis]